MVLYEVCKVFISKLVRINFEVWSIGFIRSFPYIKKYIFWMTRKFLILFLNYSHCLSHIFFLNTSIPSYPFSHPLLFITRSCARCRTSDITARSSNPKEQNRFTSLRLNYHNQNYVPFKWTLGTNSVAQN